MAVSRSLSVIVLLACNAVVLGRRQTVAHVAEVSVPTPEQKLERRWSISAGDDLSNVDWEKTFGDSNHRKSHSPAKIIEHFRTQELFPGGMKNSVFKHMLTSGGMAMTDAERRFMADYYDTSFYAAIDKDYSVNDFGTQDSMAPSLLRCGVTTPEKKDQTHALAPEKLAEIKALLKRTGLDNSNGKRPIEDLSVIKDIHAATETTAPLVPMFKALVQDVFRQIVHILEGDNSQQGNDIKEWAEKFESDQPEHESEFMSMQVGLPRMHYYLGVLGFQLGMAVADGLTVNTCEVLEIDRLAMMHSLEGNEPRHGQKLSKTERRRISALGLFKKLCAVELANGTACTKLGDKDFNDLIQAESSAKNAVENIGFWASASPLFASPLPDHEGKYSYNLYVLNEGNGRIGALHAATDEMKQLNPGFTPPKLSVQVRVVRPENHILLKNLAAFYSLTWANEFGPQEIEGWQHQAGAACFRRKEFTRGGDTGYKISPRYYGYVKKGEPRADWGDSGCH